MSFQPKAPPVYKPISTQVSPPPVYRPQQASNSSAQLKPAAHFRTETRPAPPVYRPQPANNAVLAKQPAVYRPAGVMTAVQRASSPDESPPEGHIVKYVQVDYGSREANQGAKVHIVPEGWENREAEGGKLTKMYTESPEQIRTERSYAGDRPKQILRWLATVIFQKFGGVEIQCYWEAAAGVILISSNTDAVNRQIQAAVETQTLITTVGRKSPGEHERITRHRNKLFGRAAYAEQTSIKDALGEYRIVVPDAEHEVDLHAERRIEEKLGRRLDPSCLGGVKRPCLACAFALRLVGARPGPAWTTKSALGGLSIDEVLGHAMASGVITHVTYDKLRRKLTVNYDTDSDSGGE